MHLCLSWSVGVLFVRVPFVRVLSGPPPDTWPTVLADGL
jgi:hypothetical protein